MGYMVMKSVNWQRKLDSHSLGDTSKLFYQYHYDVYVILGPSPPLLSVVVKVANGHTLKH